MKTLVCSIGIFLVAVGLASAQGGSQAPPVDPKLEEVISKLPTPGSGEVFVRTIPADVLRDHPGRCYSFNNVDFYSVNETWNINGVCAMAECMALPINQEGQLGLFEQVFDCGPSVVKSVKECTYTREVNLSQKFPDCCPTFTCTEGFDPRNLLRPAGPPAGPPPGAAGGPPPPPAEAGAAPAQ